MHAFQDTKNIWLAIQTTIWLFGLFNGPYIPYANVCMYYCDDINFL